ncbi:MAG: glycosyltransferase [Gammaproteobacteria bacterium]|nr:glycosyltransferase [Gammaproteobacteria bacterium]
MFLAATSFAACLWLIVLVLPWRPWSTRESLAAQAQTTRMDFSDTTALIPARDEARCIAETLTALDRQGKLAGIILVDDQSSDGTGEIARNLRIDKLTVIEGSALPPGWSGKLWALEQAARRVDTRYSLLLDADIALAPGMLAALRRRATDDDLQLASIMACLPMDTLWEKLLLPPFIYFFKLIYPFALSNRPTSRIAAAAGGCILIETDKLREIGGFEALHGAIIDDCTLARLIKRAGGRTWIGLSRDVRAVRPYASLENIWNMVARSAFTQLRYSTLWLVLCSVLLIVSFVVPVLALASGSGMVKLTAITALGAMGLSYVPTIRYYGLPGFWVLSLPIAACLFLLMTWTSAVRYWGGERTRWKNRSYEKTAVD